MNIHQREQQSYFLRYFLWTILVSYLFLVPLLRLLPWLMMCVHASGPNVSYSGTRTMEYI